MSTDEGNIVFDPFVGTGTTVIAAKRLGRRYIGFDMDKKYVELSQMKLAKEKTNSKIGNIWVSWFLGGLATIRDKDWDKITGYYVVPENIKDIDHTEIDFKDNKNIWLLS